MTFLELQRFYTEHFSLGYINTDIKEKFALISLICYVTYKTKMKNPDTTCYSVIMKVSQGLGIPDDFIKGLSIICEDFMYGCTEFPTFGVTGKDILKEIREILGKYLPF